MNQSFVVLYSEQKTKKNKIWHDGTLNIADGYVILKSMDGRVLHRELRSFESISVDTELDLGHNLLVQVMQLQETSNAKTKEKNFRYRIAYRKQSEQLEREGVADYDGKSMVIFKDGNGKQLARKICPDISEGETICAGDYVITVLEAVQREPKPEIYSRKALVCKSASAAAATTTQPDSKPTTQHPTLTTAPGREIKCIYTEDKQKKQKKWIDGVIKLTGNSAVIEDNDTKVTLYKRQFANIDALLDGYEFEGGKYRFQITEPTIISPPQEPIPTNRKRLLTASEVRFRKESASTATSSQAARYSENEDDNNNSNEHAFHKASSFKKAANSSLFDMFDDLH